MGKTPARTDYASRGKLKVVKFRDLQDGGINFHNSKDGFVGADGGTIRGLRELRKGDVLITAAAHSGENIGKKCAYASSLPSEFEHVFFTGELLNLRCNDETISRWVYLYFRSGEGFRTLQNSVSGVHLTGGRAKEMVVPLAPLNEQKRIVAKLDKLLDKVEISQRRLAKIPVLLKRFRQSVLAAACSGRLTADWRDKTAREKLSLPRVANPDCATEVDEIVETPDYWRWIPLQAICDPSRAICYGVIKLGLEHPKGVPCLRTSDVKPLRIDSTKVKRISPDISREYRRTLLCGGEVLVNVRGTLGGVAVVPAELRGWNISREVAVIPVAGVLAKFVAFWIASMPCQIWLTGVAKGVAYTGINIEDLKLLAVALPSLPEQEEIVRRVEALFALADQLETGIAKAQAHIDQLTLGMLAKAFRGELVPTEAERAREEGRNYEPASGLLDRIAAARKEIRDSPKLNRVRSNRRRQAR